MGRIDALLAEVAASLRGRQRRVDDLVTELRGGLEDVVEARARAGLPRAVAERVAVEEFGSVQMLALALQEVLAVEEGRRAARVTVGVLAVQPVVWSRPVTQLVWGGSDPTSAGWLLGPMATIGCLAVLLLSAGWLLSGRWSWTVGRGRRYARWVAAGAGLSVISIGALGLARSLAGLGGDVAAWRVVWAILGLFVPLCGAGHAAWLAWRAGPVRESVASG